MALLRKWWRKSNGSANGHTEPVTPAPEPPKRRSPMCALFYPAGVDMESMLDPLLNGALDPYLAPGAAKLTRPVPPLITMRSGQMTLLSVGAPMPLPGPPDDTAQHMTWPNWRAVGNTWRRHVMILPFGHGDGSLEQTRAKAEDVIRVAAILATHPGASGVEWSESQLFFRPSDFVERCQRSPLPPDVLCRVLFYRASNPQGPVLGATTRGLRLFGLPEIDLRPTGEDGEVMYNRILNVASYVLAQGAVMKDGDTIGVDDNILGSVRHVSNADGETFLQILSARDGPRKN